MSHGRFSVLFLRSNLLCTNQKSTSASFFVPAQTLITPKLLTSMVAYMQPFFYELCLSLITFAMFVRWQRLIGDCGGNTARALAQQHHSVASSEALDVCYWAMCPPLYRRIRWWSKLPATQVNFYVLSVLLSSTTIGIDHVMVHIKIKTKAKHSLIVCY